MILNGTWKYARPCIGCQKCMDNQLHHDGELICSGNAVFGHDDNDASLPEPETIKNVRWSAVGRLASKPLEWQRSADIMSPFNEAATVRRSADPGHRSAL